MAYKLSLNFICRTINNNSYLISQDKCFEINEMGTFILKEADNGQDMEQIIDEIVKKYDVDRKIVKKDVEETFDFLIANGIIEQY